jgi:hypothetical protein
VVDAVTSLLVTQVDYRVRRFVPGTVKLDNQVGLSQYRNAVASGQTSLTLGVECGAELPDATALR